MDELTAKLKNFLTAKQNILNKKLLDPGKKSVQFLNSYIIENLFMAKLF
jgi:hypothetical protein